jgi:hypothetical protein
MMDLIQVMADQVIVWSMVVVMLSVTVFVASTFK